MTRTDKISAHNSKRLYECDTCGHLSPWGKDWLWFGSIKDQDETPDAVPTFCSPECAEVKRQRQFDADEKVMPKLPKSWVSA